MQHIAFIILLSFTSTHLEKVTLEPSGNIVLSLGEKLEITCTFYSRIYALIPSWHIPKTANVSMFRQANQLADGLYIIKSIVISTSLQLGDAGKYMCHMGNNNHVDVTVFAVFAEKKNVTFEWKMKRVDLSCNLSTLDNEGSLIFNGWHYGSFPLTEGSRYTIVTMTRFAGKLVTSNLVIGSPIRNDSGFYTSEFAIVYPHTTLSYRCLVALEASPIILIPPRSIAATIGHTATLTCIVISFPKTVVTWKSDSLNLTNDAFRISYGHFGGHNNSILNINDVQESDSGMYSCFAKNEVFRHRPHRSIRIYVKSRYEWVFPVLMLIFEVNITVILTIVLTNRQNKRRLAREEKIRTLYTEMEETLDEPVNISEAELREEEVESPSEGNRMQNSPLQQTSSEDNIQQEAWHSPPEEPFIE
nr:putative peroxidasin; partial [Biomphalaria glabrata]